MLNYAAIGCEEPKVGFRLSNFWRLMHKVEELQPVAYSLGIVQKVERLSKRVWYVQTDYETYLYYSRSLPKEEQTEETGEIQNLYEEDTLIGSTENLPGMEKTIIVKIITGEGYGHVRKFYYTPKGSSYYCQDERIFFVEDEDPWKYILLVDKE